MMEVRDQKFRLIHSINDYTQVFLVIEEISCFPPVIIVCLSFISIKVNNNNNNIFMYICVCEGGFGGHTNMDRQIII